MKYFSIEELEALPTLAVGQSCNLKHDSGVVRVWLSRCTVADGEPYNNKVTVEVLDPESGKWEVEAEYAAIRKGDHDPRGRGWQTMKLRGGQS